MEKHPDSGPVSALHVIGGEIPYVEPVIFENIDRSSIYKAAKDTKGSFGPTGASSDLWRRLLCSKSFGKAAEDLCDTVAKIVMEVVH